MSDLGGLGPILGTDTCAHEQVRWYRGYEGEYAVCRACGGHFWDGTPPADAEITDLNTFEDEHPDECVHGVPWDDDCAECLAIEARVFPHLREGASNA